jgi:hypothetical protein
MSDQHFEEGLTGSTDHPQHRAPKGEGAQAPYASDTGGVPQHSIFDGKGNEIVVANTTVDGKVKQGTGDNLEEALENAQTTKEPIGEGYGGPGRGVKH